MTDVELVKACAEFRGGILDCARYGGDPDGMCFAISSALGGFLSFAFDLQCRLVEGEVRLQKGKSINHFWLEMPDGRILDATADQFNKPLRKKMPAVFLGKRPAWYRHCECVAALQSTADASQQRSKI